MLLDHCRGLHSQDLVFGPGRDLAQGGPYKVLQCMKDGFNVMIDCDEVVARRLHEVHQRLQCCKSDKKVKKK